jgi:hypothetical protein
MSQINHRGERSLHKEQVDYCKNQGENKDTAEVIEHELVVQVLSCAHAQEIGKRIHWHIERNSMSYRAEHEPDFTTQ